MKTTISRLLVLLTLFCVLPACSDDAPDDMIDARPSEDATPLLDALVDAEVTDGTVPPPPDAPLVCERITWVAQDMNPPNASLDVSSTFEEPEIVIISGVGMAVGSDGRIANSEMLYLRFDTPVRNVVYHTTDDALHSLHTISIIRNATRDPRYEVRENLQGPEIDVGSLVPDIEFLELRFLGEGITHPNPDEDPPVVGDTIVLESVSYDVCQ